MKKVLIALVSLCVIGAVVYFVMDKKCKSECCQVATECVADTCVKADSCCVMADSCCHKAACTTPCEKADSCCAKAECAKKAECPKTECAKKTECPKTEKCCKAAE